MATANKILVGIDDKVIELTGEAKEAFIADQKVQTKALELIEAEYKAKQDARESAIKKLAEIAGLTQDEIAAIL